VKYRTFVKGRLLGLVALTPPLAFLVLGLRDSIDWRWVIAAVLYALAVCAAIALWVRRGDRPRTR